jgi:hypothetical protein
VEERKKQREQAGVGIKGTLNSERRMYEGRELRLMERLRPSMHQKAN